MVAFANDPSFISAHESPLPFNYVEAAGKMISFPTSDGKNANAYEVKASTPTNNYLFVFHEWWGLNDYIKQRADDLQKSIGNVNVIAIDIYDGRVTSNADSAGSFMSQLKDVRIENIINAAITSVGKNARIATIGWCFGGGLSLKGTSLAGKQAVGCVLYYGMPITDVNKLKELNCDVFGIFGTRDKWISPEVVAQFEKDMKSAGKILTVKNYEADHAFANPSNPHFDKVSAADANANALEFLKKVFK
ncbi:carboxymethylenebutenolidase [Bacteroidota bacterium]|nr:carboxymethylenebutenolidase [Bacteroidota bacterium]